MYFYTVNDIEIINLSNTLESIMDLTKIQRVSIYEIGRLLNILD